MQPRLIVGLGELVWDEFPDGRRLGGAPANVAYHSAVLGDRSAVATAVGDDSAGREAVEFLRDRGLDVSAIQVHASAPTGRVTVHLERGQPTYFIDPSGAWRSPVWNPGWEALFSRADAICYGSLLCSSEAGREVLGRATAAAPGALRVADLNLRPPFDSDDALECAIRHAQVIKLNEEEAAGLSGRFGRQSPLEHPHIHAVAVTCGARGAELTTRQGSWRQPADRTYESGIGDPVGAGDSFTAALVHHLLRGAQPATALEAAVRYAGYVAFRPGAMPEVPASVRDSVTAAALRSTD